MNNDDVIAPECVEQLRKRGLRITEVGDYAGPSRSLLAFVEPVAPPKPRRWLVEDAGSGQPDYDGDLHVGRPGFTTPPDKVKVRIVHEMKPISREEANKLYYRASSGEPLSTFIQRLRALGVEVSDAE
jgi:hypothetical protein